MLRRGYLPWEKKERRSQNTGLIVWLEKENEAIEVAETKTAQAKKTWNQKLQSQVRLSRLWRDKLDTRAMTSSVIGWREEETDWETFKIQRKYNKIKNSSKDTKYQKEVLSKNLNEDDNWDIWEKFQFSYYDGFIDRLFVVSRLEHRRPTCTYLLWVLGARYPRSGPRRHQKLRYRCGVEVGSKILVTTSTFLTGSIKKTEEHTFILICS